MISLNELGLNGILADDMVRLANLICIGFGKNYTVNLHIVLLVLVQEDHRASSNCRTQVLHIELDEGVR